MALYVTSPLVNWMPPRKRRTAKRGTFLERHKPKTWHIALLVAFIIANELRGVAVAAAFVKAYIAA